MVDEGESRRCAVCGGPVGPDGRSLTPLPPPAAPRVQAPPAARQAEDPSDDLTPVQRFDRAIQRRDAVTPKRRSERGKGNAPGR
jgi:hypothetical protein